MLEYKILVLNISYEPIGVTTSKSVIKKLIAGTNVTVEKYYPYKYKTVNNFEIQIPAVIRTHKYISIKHFNRKSCAKSDIYHRDNYTCVYCGVRPKILTVDHVLPRARGGVSSYSNLVTSCMECNSKKGDKTPEEANLTFIKKIPSTYNHIIALINRHGTSNEYWADYLYK